MYNVTFTIAAVETQQCILHVELHVTVNYTKKMVHKNASVENLCRQ
jgi:hypothetical protein